MACYLVSKVFRKETTFSFWRAMDKLWNKYVVSFVSSVTMVMCLPISRVSLIAMLCRVPAVSVAMG